MSGFVIVFGILPYTPVVATTWTLCSLAAIATCGRLYIRLRRRRFAWDDCFNILALVSLIAFSMIFNLNLALTTYYFDASVVSAFHRYDIASSMLGWVVLFSVKAAFLALCRVSFGASTTFPFRKAWWVVVGYTFVSFCTLILMPFWQCGDPSEYAVGVICLPSYGYYIITAGITLFLHVSSDLLILALPLVLIKSLRLSKTQKISVAAVFLLIVVNICMAVSRIVAFILVGFLPQAPINHTATLDVYVFMAVCEPAIAVIICALPAYWVLLPSVGRKRSDPKDAPQRRMMPWHARKTSSCPQISTLPVLETMDIRMSRLGSTQYTTSQAETVV